MQFTRPITVLVGLGFPSTINSVERAYAVLVDWPPSQRGPAHELALRTCQDVLGGSGDAEAVRAAFVQFARGVGILTSDPARAVTAAAMSKAGRSGAPT